MIMTSSIGSASRQVSKTCFGIPALIVPIPAKRSCRAQAIANAIMPPLEMAAMKTLRIGDLCRDQSLNEIGQKGDVVMRGEFIWTIVPFVPDRVRDDDIEPARNRCLQEPAISRRAQRVAGIGVQQNQRRARTFLQLVQQGAPVSRHVHLNGVRNTAGLVRNHPGEDCRKENSGK
ncbi:MAG TPA: hypothetical protein VFE89_02085 [Beijerinckiaceae bacterium]|nr:hypothetical protein [Beijerinckiaceae bacterium]